jgi:hypothetical protein
MLQLFFAVALIGGAVCTEVDSILSMDNAARLIHTELANQASGYGLGEDSYAKCTMGGSQACPLSDMAKDETTVVDPGGETRCISADSGPFGFQVIPGDSDKLMIYFQGGGACWDRLSTDLHFCSYDAIPSTQVGIFDRDNERNAFRDYTVVQILYCSGDVHGGDVTRPYTDPKGQPVVQKGLANTQSAIDWVQAQQAAGLMSAKLSSLYIGGCSAGSIGTQLWAKAVNDAFPAEHAAIAPDSYAGVFPQESEGALIRGFGFCGADILDPLLKPACYKENLKIQDINLKNMNQVNHIPFTFINSKRDTTQMAFFYAIAGTTNSTIHGSDGGHLTSAMYFDAVNRLFEGYAHEPNFATYLVDGGQHCFTNKDLYYNANPLSHNGKIPSNQEKLTEWVNGLETADVNDVYVVCGGRRQATDPEQKPVYCDSAYA